MQIFAAIGNLFADRLGTRLSHDAVATPVFLITNDECNTWPIPAGSPPKYDGAAAGYGGYDRVSQPPFGQFSTVGTHRPDCPSRKTSEHYSLYCLAQGLQANFRRHTLSGQPYQRLRSHPPASLCISVCLCASHMGRCTCQQIW